MGLLEWLFADLLMNLLKIVIIAWLTRDLWCWYLKSRHILDKLDGIDKIIDTLNPPRQQGTFRGHLNLISSQLTKIEEQLKKG